MDQISNKLTNISIFVNNLKFFELEPTQLFEFEVIILMKKSEFETLKNKISSQINDIEGLANFLQINNVENIYSTISNLDMHIVENYEGKEIIKATLKKIITSSILSILINNNGSDSALKKIILEGMELIRNRNVLLQPNKVNIANLVNDLKKLDNNDCYYWKIKVIPLESYLKKWDQLNRYQNQTILQSFQNWKNLSVEEKEQKKKQLVNKNKLQVKLSNLIIDNKQLEGENKMETINNTEIKNVEKVELKKSEILNEEYKRLGAVRKIARLEKLVGDFVSMINNLKSDKEVLTIGENNAKKNVEKLTEKLAEESLNTEFLIKDAKEIVIKEFSGLVKLVEVLNIKVEDKPEIEKLLVNHAVEEEGLSGLVTVIELKNEQIDEQDKKIETLEAKNIFLKKEIGNLNLKIDNNLVIDQENASETLTNLIYAEQTIRKLQLGVKFESSYVRFNEQKGKLETEEKFKKEEKTQSSTEEESDHENSESDHSEFVEKILDDQMK